MKWSEMVKMLATLVLFYAILAVVMLQGCASLSNSVPVKIACTTCALMYSTGLCGGGGGTLGMVKAEGPVGPASIRCPSGQVLYIINYRDVMQHQSAPDLECRKP